MRAVLLAFSLFILQANTLNLTDDKLKDEWSQFKVKFNRTYTTEKEKEKLQSFAENREKIREHNKRFELGRESFKLGLNRYGDMTFEEIQEYHTPNTTVDDFFARGKEIFLKSKYLEFDDKIKVPATLDWREHGAVTSVKDQMQCASCWAFAPIAIIESQYFLKTGKLVDLSAQQLVDCVDQKFGCNGGGSTSTYNYIMRNKISLEADYPYQAKQGKCKENVTKLDVQIVGYAEVASNEEALKQAIALHGPVEVFIGFIHESFMRYAEGVYFDHECDGNITNHAVVVVGYGRDETLKADFWIIKNTWGEDWGEKGFMKIARNQGNQCGVALHGYFLYLTEPKGLIDIETTETVSEKSTHTIAIFVIISFSAFTAFLLYACYVVNSNDDKISKDVIKLGKVKVTSAIGRNTFV